MATNSILDDADLDIFTLIWLDAAIDDSENEVTQSDLRQLSDQFKPFDNTNDCESYIQSLPIDERIVLIVSGRLGREIVPRIHELEQIHSIYVYCFDKKANTPWTKDYSKIKDVLTGTQELIEKIRHDNKKEISPINKNLLYINIYTNNPDDEFIRSQLLINHLIKMKIYSTINTKFFISCKTEYPDENLDEFQENYSSENSLCWLTKLHFLSKLISKSFHTKNIDLLYSIRFFIRDINHQLQSHQCTTPIHVYHAHLITSEEIEQLKNSIGKLISINTFFITKLHRNQVLLSLNQSNESEKILFEIDADPSINGIKPFSYTKKQSEIIFMLGSIFRIKNFYQENSIWICQMVLSSANDDDDDDDGDSETDLLAFGNILARIHQYDDAEKYYQYILKDLSTDHPNTYICYKNLGNLAYLKKDYEQSIEYHLKSLEIKKRLLKPTDLSLADSYNCLGIVYFNKNDYQQAIDNYEKGLNILELNLNENALKTIVCLNNIALVYRMEDNYSKALEYYRKNLDIQKKYLTEDQEDLGQIYHNIGATYWCLGFYDDALKYYNLSLEHKCKFLVAKHPSIAMTLENMGLIHENQQDFQQAYKYYQQAANIYQNDSDVIQIQNNISRVVSCHF